MFGIVIAVAVQSAFRLQMHQDNVFFFKKIIFDISASKRSKNTKKILIFFLKIQIVWKRVLDHVSKRALSYYSLSN